MVYGRQINIVRWGYKPTNIPFSGAPFSRVLRLVLPEGVDSLPERRRSKTTSAATLECRHAHMVKDPAEAAQGARRPDHREAAQVGISPDIVTNIREMKKCRDEWVKHK